MKKGFRASLVQNFFSPEPCLRRLFNSFYFFGICLIGFDSSPCLLFSGVFSPLLPSGTWREKGFRASLVQIFFSPEPCLRRLFNSFYFFGICLIGFDSSLVYSSRECFLPCFRQEPEVKKGFPASLVQIFFHLRTLPTQTF